jgi:hypothetical protein
MNTIFEFLDYNTLYNRCVMASVAHAVMAGEYGFLSAGQSWDASNYNFQDMEGVRGVISFAEDKYICVIQNNNIYEPYTDQHVSEILNGADAKIIDLANKEALQYMLIEHNGKTVPFISAAFWGSEGMNYSAQSEEQILRISENIIMPFLYSENDAKMYWKDYYEMTKEQTRLTEEIFNRRINTDGKLVLAVDEINKLKEWFGDIGECIESFQELEIYLAS